MSVKVKTNQGIIKAWIAPKGFGFIQTINPDNSVDVFFCHICDIISGSPIIGQRVRFDVDYDVKPGAYPHAILAEVDPKEVKTVGDGVQQ